MTGDDSATLRFRVRKNFGDRYAEARAWSVPSSDRYPEGVKYAFQYGTLDGETIIRYDNFPDHPGAAPHHKHTADGDVVPVDFDGVGPLFERFQSEVRAYGHDWD